VIRVVPDPAARSLAFENGEADILHSSAVPVPDLPRLIRTPSTKLHLSRQLGVAALATMNLRTAQLRDRRVRQAIAHAVDRQFIRENVLPVVSERMIGPLWPFSPLCNRALPDYALDPARAQKLLDEAEFPKGSGGIRFTLRLLWAASDVRLARIAEVMARNLAGVGIKLALSPLERATLIQRAYVANAFDIVLDFFALGPDPDFGTERLYHSGNIKPSPSANTSAYTNLEVDRLFEEQRNQTDPLKRREVYAKIQQLIWADMPILPLAAVGVPTLSNARFVTNVFDQNWTAQADGFVSARPA
jgi:peptide/nickel transport system substrate-binding protein